MEDIWSSDRETRNKELEKSLDLARPIDGGGKVVLSLRDLESAIPVSKAILMERSGSGRKSQVFKRHTSGTSGKRTEVFLNREEISRMLAVRDYCFRHYGVRLGEREARIWGNTSSNYIDSIRDSLLNRKLFSVAGIDIGPVIASIKEWRPKYIYGYSSSIIKLAKYLDSNKDFIESVKLVVCTAEQILPTQKRYLSEIFDANVVEEYGSTEFDVVGFEDRSGRLRSVNPWLVLENNERTILVSDVLRKSQSFIRYEIGDVADLALEESEEFGGEIIIKSLEGRDANQFAFLDDNNTFHASEFSRAMNDYFESFSEIFDFVVVQKEIGTFQIYLNKEPECSLPCFETVYRKFLKNRVGYDVPLTLEVRSELSKISNKRTYFIQNVKVS